MKYETRRSVPSELAIDTEAVATRLEAFIRERTAVFKRAGAVLGLSGGVDSALVATLAARAIGPERVLGLIMPERDSEPQSERDARELADNLGIRVERIDLTPPLQALGVYRELPLRLLGPRRVQAGIIRGFYGFFSRRPGQRLLERFIEGNNRPGHLPDHLAASGKAYADSKHRLRMVCWYYRAEAENLLVLGTCNRTEKLTGFFVKYGDSAADIAPIEGLYKTQVFQLARYVGVTPAILDKPPSPDLLPGITDEQVFGLNYETLDRILYRLERNMPAEQVASDLQIDKAWVDFVVRLNEASRHMRELPEVGPV